MKKKLFKLGFSLLLVLTLLFTFSAGCGLIGGEVENGEEKLEEDED